MLLPTLRRLRMHPALPGQLQPGDRILEIDGLSIAGMTTDQVVQVMVSASPPYPFPVRSTKMERFEYMSALATALVSHMQQSELSQLLRRYVTVRCCCPDT